MATPGYFNHFPAIAAILPHALSDIVHETTDEMTARAVARAPRDTGALAASGHAVYAPGEGGVDDGQVVFDAVNAKGEAYGFFVEVGTVHQGAEPFLLPASEATRPDFIGKLERLETRLVVP